MTIIQNFVAKQMSMMEKFDVAKQPRSGQKTDQKTERRQEHHTLNSLIAWHV